MYATTSACFRTLSFEFFCGNFMGFSVSQKWLIPLNSILLKLIVSKLSVVELLEFLSAAYLFKVLFCLHLYQLWLLESTQRFWSTRGLQLIEKYQLVAANVGLQKLGHHIADATLQILMDALNIQKEEAKKKEVLVEENLPAPSPWSNYLNFEC